MSPEIDAMYEQGVEALERRNLEEAQASFRRVIDVNPRHVSALYRLGECQEMRGDQAMALWFYSKVLEVNAEHSLAQDKIRVLSEAIAKKVDSRTATQKRAEEIRRQRRAGWESLPIIGRIAFSSFVIFVVVVLILIFVTIAVSVMREF